jgi:hypothetical protein
MTQKTNEVFLELHIHNTRQKNSQSLLSNGRLGGVVVSVLATGPEGCGFEPGQGDGFLRAIKVSSTPSFRIGSKAGGPMS